MRRTAMTLVVVALLAAACTAAESAEPATTATVSSAADAGVAEAAGTESTTTSAVAPAATTTTRTPTSTSPTTTTPPRGRLIVSATGDVNLDPSYIPMLAAEGYDFAWSGLQDMFRTDDVTIINLECAASDMGAPLDKQFTFRCDTAALPIAREAGVEVANLGNNHSGDYGKSALVDSRANLIEAGIAPVGVGKNAAEAHKPAILEANGWTVAVVGFGGVVPSPNWIATEDRAGMADGDNAETMAAAVAAAAEIADIVLVTVHWGTELDTTPRPEDRRRAEAMIAAGADAIFGHHAHRLQPLEFVNGVPVAWGLGNFVWPTLSEAGSTTAVAQVIFEPDGSVDACLIPTFIEAPGHPVLQVEYDPDHPCG